MGEVTEANSSQDLAAKYLTFRLGSEEYGIEILKVREIIGLMPITPVPRAREHIRGVINLRGAIIPVLDLRMWFGMPSLAPEEQTAIVVIDTETASGPGQMGLLVDSMCEVLNIDIGSIEPPPTFGDSDDLGFIRAVAKCKGRARILLDTDRIVREDACLGVDATAALG